jgi:uncharacterized protein YcfJ
MTAKSLLFAAAAALALGLAAAPFNEAQAAGCLKGAIVGGVAGHYAGHHFIAGAIGGCIIGHHVAAVNAEKLREEKLHPTPMATPMATPTPAKP